MNLPLPHDSALLDLLLDRHDQATASSLREDCVQYGVADTLFELFEELQDASSKIASEAVWTLAEFRRRCGLETVIPGWILVSASPKRGGPLAFDTLKKAH